MPRLTYIPRRVIDINGIADGATVYVYQSGTTTPVNLYADVAGTIPLSNPYTVAVGALIPPIYYTYTGNVRLKIVSESGAIDDQDPYPSYVLTTDLSSLAPAAIADRTTLAGLTSPIAGQVRYLLEAGLEGEFKFDSSNLSSQVTNDPLNGIYVAPASAPTGASGAWVRVNRDIVNVLWFMTAAQAADVRAFTYTQNVQPALNAAANYISFMDGGHLFLPPGGYLVGEQVRGGQLLDQPGTSAAWGPTHIITIKNCTKPVKISGYGAVLKAIDGLRFGSFDPATGLRYDPAELPFLDFAYYGSPYRGMIYVQDNQAVVIEGLELDGNNTKYVLGGYFGDSTWQNEASGISAQNNASLVVRDCNIHHHGQDGIGMRGGVATEGSAPTPILIENCKLRYNGRLGMSHVGGKGVTVINCDLSMTGQALNTVSAEMVQATPGSGVDIEAEQGVIRDMQFINCTMLSNWRQGVTAASGDSRRVTFRDCKIENLTCGRPTYAFENCTILGHFDVGLASVDPYGATATGLTLTISGSGPYTIHRSAGDFTAAGFAVGKTIQLAGGGLNANNNLKNLTITGSTAADLTVKVDGGGTLTAEGPIAACTVQEAYTAKDGQTFKRCAFLYDASMTELGTLVDGSQARLVDFIWGRVEDCTFNTGTVALPNLNVTTPVRESHPLFANCRFKSTSSTALNLYARYQGRNYVDYGATPGFNFGTDSWIETGDVIVNGVAQATGPTIADGDYGDVKVSGTGTVMKVESVNLVGTGGFPVNAPAATDLTVDLNAAPGQYRLVRFQSGGTMRWGLGANNTAESGSNAGSNLDLYRYSDGSGFLGTTISINRATGNIVVEAGLTSAGGGIGYSTGAGGAVTQLTNKSTGVTLNKATGQITMNNAALAAGAKVSFAVSNTSCAATDIPVVAVVSGGTANAYRANVTAVAANSFTITVENITAGSLSEAPVIGFAIIKGVTA